MKQAKTIKQLKEEYKTIKSVVSEDTRFLAISNLFIAERIDDISAKGLAEQDKLHWLMNFLKDNKLVIGDKEGKAFKELSFEELHEIYEDSEDR